MLILDPQNDFFGPDNPNLAEFTRVVPTINAGIALFREFHSPVVFIQHTSSKKPEGSYAWEIYEAFHCRPEDMRLCKRYPNAFWQTELDELLKSSGIDFVVVAGFVAEHCVLSTVRGAWERHYRAAILEGAIASLNDQHARFVLEVSSHVTLAELRAKMRPEPSGLVEHEPNSAA